MKKKTKKIRKNYFLSKKNASELVTLNCLC